jgi:predicted Zn-dependent peptidase
MSEKKYKLYTFPNKFRVIYQHLNQSLPITSIQVFCKVGSILETEKVRGISHFVEHMCFKGTKKMVHLNEVFENYDEIGAYINAYTEKEFTCYTLKCSDTYVENSTHILADMMLNSTIPKKEFLKEQKVVVEENIRNINDDEWFFFDKLNAIFLDNIICISYFAISVFFFNLNTLFYNNPS